MLIRYFSYLCGHIANKASKGRKGSWLEKIEHNGREDTTQQKKACVIREIWRSWVYDTAQCLKQLPTNWSSSLEIYKTWKEKSDSTKLSSDFRVSHETCTPPTYTSDRQAHTHAYTLLYTLYNTIIVYIHIYVFEYKCIWIQMHMNTFVYLLIYVYIYGVCYKERQRTDETCNDIFCLVLSQHFFLMWPLFHEKS